MEGGAFYILFYGVLSMLTCIVALYVVARIARILRIRIFADRQFRWIFIAIGTMGVMLMLALPLPDKFNTLLSVILLAIVVCVILNYIGRK